jgi:hypothetical protein
MTKELWIEEMIENEVTPKPLRKETVLDFCARHLIAENTYYYQARKKENQERIIELSLNVAKASVPAILQVLVEKAKDGDMKAIDTYLDSVAKFSKNIDIKMEVNTITDEQANRIIQRRATSISESSK